jgi:putative ABC transport system permease protein
VLRLALKSLLNRRLPAALLVCSIALSVALLAGVERVRTQTETSFTRAVAGTDLVVGARSGPVNLMLYSVFRIGDATNNIRWSSYEAIAKHPRIAWTVPLSLGDSHRGFRVLGTTGAYFEHYRTGTDRPLAFREGKPFADVFEAVLGSEVAARLGYRVGQEITIAHGTGDVSFAEHDDKPFRVTGILAPTGTAVDRTVHVPLEGIEAIHLDWQGGAQIPGLVITPEQARKLDLSPKAITAFLVGVKSKAAVFQLQRQINEYRDEPLLAVLPGVALQQVWEVVGVAERALFLVAAAVAAASLAGLVALHLAALDARRRELAILRALGAPPRSIFGLVIGESFLLTLAGLLLGMAFLQAGLAAAAPFIETRFGLVLAPGLPSLAEFALLGAVLFCGTLAGAIPAWRAYRLALTEGMTLRL